MCHYVIVGRPCSSYPNVQAAVPAAVFSALPSWTRDQQIGSAVNHYSLGC